MALPSVQIRVGRSPYLCAIRGKVIPSIHATEHTEAASRPTESTEPRFSPGSRFCLKVRAGTGRFGRAAVRISVARRFMVYFAPVRATD